MTPFSFIRKIGKLIRGGAGTPQILMGWTFGLILGLTVGFNALTLILLALCFALNANKPLAGIAALLGKVVAMIFPAALFYVGHFTIHGIGFGGMWRALFNAPILALFDLHVYTRMGGLVVGVVLGIAGGLAISRAVRGIRTAMIKAHQASEKMQIVSRNRFVRFLAWVVFGKQKKSLEEMLQTTPSMIRTGRVVALAVVVIPLLAVDLFVTGPYLGGKMQSAIGEAVGAETNIQSATLSILRGKLTVDGLQVTNPEKPTHNLIQAKRLSAGVSVWDLLAKRLVLSEIHAQEVLSDAKRDKPGEVYPLPEVPEDQPQDVFTDYFEKSRDYREYLDHIAKVRKWLQERQQEHASKGDEQPASTPTAGETQQARQEEGIAWNELAADSLLAARATWTIRHLDVSGVTRPDNNTLYSIQGEEVSSHPDRNGKPMMIRLQSDKDLLVELVFAFTDDSDGHRLRLNVPDINVKGMLGNKSRVKVEQGKAHVQVDGRFTPDLLDMPVLISASDLEIVSSDGKGVLGMDAERSKQMLDQARDLSFAVRLEGIPHRPRLVIDDKTMLNALIESAKTGVVRMGTELITESLRSRTATTSPSTQPAEKPPLGGLLDRLKK